MSIEFSITLERGDQFRMNASASAPASGTVALVGPSGAGKTTLLRGLAGLETQLAGRIRFNGQDWLDSARDLNRPTAERRVGYVFQNGALFKHLSVSQNIDYAIRRTGGEGGRSKSEVAALTGITHLLDRPPQSLSGGETQRVALARALASNPQLLLLDEPFSALDWRGREDLLQTMERFFREIDVPSLLVTHNLSEAARLSSHALRMESGEITANGPSTAVLPESYYTSEERQEPFSTCQGRVASLDPKYHLCKIEAPIGPLLAPAPDSSDDAPRRIIIWARDVSLSLRPVEDTSHLNVLAASVTEVTPFDACRLLISLRCGSGELQALITRKSGHSLRLERGTQCFCLIKSVSLA